MAALIPIAWPIIISVVQGRHECKPLAPSGNLHIDQVYELAEGEFRASITMLSSSKSSSNFVVSINGSSGTPFSLGVVGEEKKFELADEYFSALKVRLKRIDNQPGSKEKIAYAWVNLDVELCPRSH